MLVAKLCADAMISWVAVSCSDLLNYRVYGSAAYNATFPSDWTILSNSTSTSFSEPLSSSDVAYKVLSIDACGNLSQN